MSGYSEEGLPLLDFHCDECGHEWSAISSQDECLNCGAFGFPSEDDEELYYADLMESIFPGYLDFL